MIKEKVKTIIENLIISTNNDDLDWIDKSSVENRNFHREYYAIAEDGTRYETEVKYSLISTGSNSGTWQLESGPAIWVRNKNLPNGYYFIYCSDNDIRENIFELRKVIMDKYCKDMKPSEKIVEDALDNIAKGISLSTHRDNKLNKILNVFGLSK